MNLYRKYQPTTWEEILGNKSEVDALQANLARDGGPHSFLIQGPAGCGKGTVTRIAAREIGGDDLSIKEINTADDRGIDAVRGWIEQMRFIPPGGKPRVYIIDEAHGLTPDAKRALLKPLEDTPEHVYFFLLTTHPQKLFQGDEGKALKTRLTPVTVKELESKIIYKHLKRIAKKEGALSRVSSDLIEHISENCGGSPRQAIVLLDSIIDMENEDEQRDKLEDVLLGDDPEVIDFCRAVFSTKTKWPQLGKQLAAFKGKKDPEGIRQAVMGYLQSILLKNGNGRAAWQLECFCDYEYKNGFPGLTLATYQAFVGEE